MTRREFIEDITTWYELLDFCSCRNLSACENIIEGELLSEHIAEDMLTFGDEYRWTDIRDWLCQIRVDAPYYLRLSSFEYRALSDADFTDYKEEAMAECDDNDLWDPDYFNYDIDDILVDCELFVIGDTAEPSCTEHDIEESEFSVDSLIGWTKGSA